MNYLGILVYLLLTENLFSRSSRSKRKENRKLLDTRKGSQYEDIAIIRELYDISHQAFEAGQTVRKTLLLAIRLGLPLELSIVVQDALKTIQASVARNLTLIWPDLNNYEEVQLKAIQLNYGHLSKLQNSAQCELWRERERERKRFGFRSQVPVPAG